MCNMYRIVDQNNNSETTIWKFRLTLKRERQEMRLKICEAGGPRPVKDPAQKASELKRENKGGENRERGKKRGREITMQPKC